MYRSGLSSLVQEQMVHASLGMTVHLFKLSVISLSVKQGPKGHKTHYSLNFVISNINVGSYLMNFDFLIWSIFSFDPFNLNFLRLNLSPSVQFQPKPTQKRQETDFVPICRPNFLSKLECPKLVLTAADVALCSIQLFVMTNWQRGTQHPAGSHGTDAVMVAKQHKVETHRPFDWSWTLYFFLDRYSLVGVTVRILEPQPGEGRAPGPSHC